MSETLEGTDDSAALGTAGALRKPMLIDCLQFCNWSDRIFRQMREGGLDAVHATVVYHGCFRDAVHGLEEWNRLFAAHRDLIVPGRTSGDIAEARRSGRTAIFLGFQNPSPIGDDFGLVEVFHSLGIRFMQLAYNNQSLLASGWKESCDSGLTLMGRKVVSEMNRLGMVVDMSHAGERSALEAIEASEVPVAVTHANPSSWRNTRRNLSEDVIGALAATGGMVGLSLYPHHLRGGSDCTIGDFCEMTARTAERHGAWILGIGSDLCQDRPPSALTWMREGRWSGTTADPNAEGFPAQPSWFRDNQGLRQPGEGTGRSRIRCVGSCGNHGRQLVPLSEGGAGRQGQRDVTEAGKPANTSGLRPPDEVMCLPRMGSAHPTRLSFMRQLIRNLQAGRVKVERELWRMDSQGYGEAVYGFELDGFRYGFCAFTAPLDPGDRTDRVIASAWDATFALHDGPLDEPAMERLRRNVPKQEAGRFRPTELIISRANRSVRMFEHVVDRLSVGLQPEVRMLRRVGYLMRTTAVYGNGKFGLADRCRIAGRKALAGPFQAELLTVWLIRSFSHDLAEHIARCRNPHAACRLAPPCRRALGIGNATGLGHGAVPGRPSGPHKQLGCCQGNRPGPGPGKAAYRSG